MKEKKKTIKPIYILIFLLFLIAINLPNSSIPKEKLPASVHENSEEKKSELSVPESTSEVKPKVEFESQSQAESGFEESEPEACTNCNFLDGWMNKGLSYPCCDGDKNCICQMQEYQDYYCLETSCSYLVTNTKIIKYSCINCDLNEYCSGGNCYSSNPSSKTICSYNFYNCSDFTTHLEAQTAFEFCGGANNDIHYLDGDNDGIACESLTSSPESPEPILEPSPPSLSIVCSYNAYNCSDFSTHLEAQSVFEYCGGISKDIHRLDGDNDGIACESLP